MCPSVSDPKTGSEPTSKQCRFVLQRCTIITISAYVACSLTRWSRYVSTPLPTDNDV